MAQLGDDKLQPSEALHEAFTGLSGLPCGPDGISEKGGQDRSMTGRDVRMNCNSLKNMVYNVQTRALVQSTNMFNWKRNFMARFTNLLEEKVTSSPSVK